MSKPNIQAVCAACGSTDVRSDAFAAWCVETQEWVLSSTLDGTCCEQCGEECDIEWKPVVEDSALLAAPELLAALKDALRMLPAFPPHDPERYRFDAIRAAIAKAEGGAP